VVSGACACRTGLGRAGPHSRNLMRERCFLVQGFTTDNDVALEQLFGEHSEGTRDYDACIETIATRLSTVFASLKVLAR